jgi:AcrR family transcriptional regulator
MQNSKTDVKCRILKVAAEVFAEHGFRHGTVREICKRAEVNVASINYYFGDKEKLYIDVVNYWKDVAFEKYPFDCAMDQSKPPEERLRAWIRSILFMMIYEKESPWFGKLITREAAVEPTRVLDDLVEESIFPAINLLFSIVKQLLGKEFSEESVHLYSASIVGQCVYFYSCRHIVARLFHYEKYDIEDIEKIAEHITRFSLNAIKLASNEKGKDE